MSKGSRRRQATEGLFMVSSFSSAEKEAKKSLVTTTATVSRLAPLERNYKLQSAMLRKKDLIVKK